MPENPTRVESIFARHRREWQRLLAKTARKLRRQLDRTGVRYSMRHRVKSLESYLDKQAHASRASGSEIKDLLGLRITVPFQEDVELVVDTLERAFTVLEVERKAEQLSAREFAYDSVHLILVEPNRSTVFPPGCLAASFEVQVRTILQDAWAEIEHELIYKGDFEVPDPSVKKKLAALNASLTLSDMIFQEVRDRQNELRQWGSKRFRELEKRLRVGGVEDLPRLACAGPAPSPLEAREMDAVLEAALNAHDEKDYPLALRQYSRALEMAPGASLRAALYNHRGLVQFMLRDERAALDDFERSVSADPSYWPALNNSALVWRRFGYIQRSLECFDRSLSLQPRQADVYFMRAQSLFEIGDVAEALQSVDAALEAEPEYAEARRLRIRIHRALLDPKRSEP